MKCLPSSPMATHSIWESFTKKMGCAIYRAEQSHDTKCGNKIYGAVRGSEWEGICRNTQGRDSLSRTLLILMETFHSTDTYCNSLSLSHTHNARPQWNVSRTYQSKYFLCRRTHFWRGKDGLRGTHNKSLIAQFGVKRMSLTQCFIFYC